MISPVFASTFIPPAYFMFAKAKNKPKGVLKFINTLLIIELLSIILENDPHKNVDIVLTNLSQREMLLEFFGVLQSTTLQRGGIPEEYFEERIFIKLTKDFLTNFFKYLSKVVSRTISRPSIEW